MSFAALSAISLRFARLKFSLFALALIALLLPAAVSGQQTFTGGAIAVGRTQTAPSSGTITISGATGSSIGTLKIVLNGLTTDGTACVDGDCWSLIATSFYLQAPNGGPTLVLLGGVGDGIDGDDAVDSGSGLVNATITIADSAATTAPNDTAISPQGGTFTYKPTSYFVTDSQTPPLGTEADFPQPDGTATLTGKFAGIGINNSDQWTLTIENGEGLTTPINISSWQMIVTYASTTPTSTVVTSSQNPAFTTSPNNTVTLTATVTPASGPTGTVAFTDNGTTISGCGAVALSGGVAHCSATMPQGYNNIEATYGGGGGFGQSSGSLTQLIEVHPTANGSNSWCNDTSFTAPLNGTSIVYPAVINISSYSPGTTVGNVTLELKSVTEGAPGAGIDAQFLLVAPGGANNLDFLDEAFNTEASGAVNLFISDTGSNTPNQGTPVTNDTYIPYDGEANNPDVFPASNSPIVDSSIPSVPGTINFAAPHGKTNSLTLQQAFSGAPANGDWALYATASNGSDALTVGGWCITLDPNTGVGTTTSLSSNASGQKATFGSNVTLIATVTVQGSGTPITSGTVEFKDETTGAVLASANPLDGTGVATVTISTLAEGDHKILASYSGTGSFNTSFANLYLRIDHATTITGGGATFQYCNPGAITIPEGSSGPETPNPSNIFVSNLPGTLNTATLTLKNFSILVGDQLDNTASLVVGPTGAALDFFSNTADGTIGDEALAGNYIFADSAGALVSSGSGNISAGTYRPTSYVGTDNANDVFTADTGGFFTLPGSFGYSASRGTSTFANKFLNGSSADGTWSLYFNSPNANINGTGAAGGWCMNLTENLPSISVSGQSASTFAQGGTGSLPAITITNNGTGSIGDPTQTTANAMTVTDTLPIGLTYSSKTGTDWSCSASGQTVTCTNEDTVAQAASYNALTINVTVSATASGSIGNNTVAVSDVEASNTPASTNGAVTIDVAPVFTSANNTTFKVGTAGSFIVTASGTPAPTFSETGALPTGVTLTNTGNLSGTPAAGTGGTYPITITASNGSVDATQGFTLTVDQAPAITSVANTTFTVGTAGSFTVIASGFPAPTFSATGALPSGVTLSSSGVLSGTPGAGTGGTYPITITANNGVSPNGTQSFTLTVDQAPAITSANSTTFTVGTAGSFTVVASGNPASTFSETGALPSGVTLSTGGLLSGTPAAGTGGTYTITITAANGTTNATQIFTLTVDQAPSITSTNSATFTAGTAGSFTATATGFPSPSFTETGALPSGVTLSTGGLLAGTPAAGSGGTYTITITASNGVSPNATQIFTLTVNQAPVFTSAASTTFTAGMAGSFTVTASGNPAATFSETGALPSGVTLSAGGLLSGTPAAGSGGTYIITITAANGATSTQNFTMTVDQAPRITSANSTTFTAGAVGSFTAIASGFPTATFSETGALPSGVTLSCGGLLSGTPAAGSGGTYPITITASNGVSPNATQSFTLTVNQSLAITSGNSNTFTVGTAGTFTVTTTGSPAPTLSETGALPSGVTFVNNGNGTATLAGTPAPGSGGTYTFTITASNGVSPNATQTFTLTVDQAPAITSGNSTTFTVGTAGSFTMTASGFPSATFSETGPLPTGVTLSSSGVLSGTPAAGTGGVYPITVTASNGVGSNATQTFTLTVDQAPAITSGNSTAFPVNAADTFTVTTTGFPNSTLSETGALPSGVTFVNNGNGTATLAGTPAAGTGGTYPITITASNGVSPNATQSFTLTVSQSTATITLGSLLQTYSGTPLSATATTVPASLPVTFTYNGLSTAPTAAGSYAVVATVNSSGYTGTTSGTLVIAKALLTVTANNASMPVGTAVPALTASYGGFVPGDTVSVLSGSPSLTTTATSSSPIGSYPITITQGTLAAANYTFTFVNGTLSVVQAPNVAITATATLTKVSGGYQATITVTNTGTGTAANVQLTSATLGSATGSPLPQSLGTLAAGGGSATVTVTFPSSAGVDGATVAERYSFTYTGGSFSYSLRAATLP